MKATEAAKVRMRSYYQGHKKEWAEKIRNHAVIGNFIIRAARSSGCVDCGETDMDVLDFDHSYGEKSFDVRAMRNYGVPKILAEIAKCEVRCANCHRRMTVRRKQESICA